MEITLGLTLPRDELTVPVARNIVRTALDRVGVEEACAHDVVVALSEACTNVLLHAGPGDEYAVRVYVEDERCRIRVVDMGRGFDPVPPGKASTQPEAEQGRGMTLMRALVDQVRFTSRPEAGTIVTLEKTLEFADTALLRDGGGA
jgi:serine/threonine-protein kinase RsbW